MAYQNNSTIKQSLNLINTIEYILKVNLAK